MLETKPVSNPDLAYDSDSGLTPVLLHAKGRRHIAQLPKGVALAPDRVPQPELPEQRRIVKVTPK